MDRSFVADNARASERLRALVDRLSDEQLGLDLGGGWTVATALAHLAFWDYLSLARIRRWKESGVSASALDLDVINDALVPVLRHVPGRKAADLAVSAAEAVDAELESLPASLVEAIERLGDRRRLFRATHRGMHMDQIEDALGDSGHSG